MISQVMIFINSALSSVGSWFTLVLTRTQTVELYIAFLFIFFAFKFILSPIFGLSSISGRIKSDMARSKKEASKAKSGKGK